MSFMENRLSELGANVVKVPGASTSHGSTTGKSSNSDVRSPSTNRSTERRVSLG